MISQLLIIIVDCGFEIFEKRKKKQLFILNLFNSTTYHIEYINTPYSKLSNGYNFSIYECKTNARQVQKLEFNVPNVYSQFSTQHYTSHKSVNANTSSSHVGSRGMIGMSLMTVVFFMERLLLGTR